MAATCTLIGLYPQPLNLPAPSPGGSYAVYQVSGFSESGVQAFIRLVPALGVALAQSQIPLDKVDGLNQLITAICDYVSNGQINDEEIFLIVESLRQLL